MQSTTLNPADLVVSTFETATASTLSPLPTTDPTAETRCFYCPIDYSIGGCL
jgi:hypothetical protein